MYVNIITILALWLVLMDTSIVVSTLHHISIASYPSLLTPVFVACSTSAESDKHWGGYEANIGRIVPLAMTANPQQMYIH